MKDVTTIGIDLAKSVFQVHGIDATGEPVVQRRLRRRQVLRFFEKLPRCLIGMEACTTSHHRALTDRASSRCPGVFGLKNL